MTRDEALIHIVDNPSMVVRSNAHHLRYRFTWQKGFEYADHTDVWHQTIIPDVLTSSRMTFSPVDSTEDEKEKRRQMRRLTFWECLHRLDGDCVRASGDLHDTIEEMIREELTQMVTFRED